MATAADMDPLDFMSSELCVKALEGSEFCKNISGVFRRLHISMKWVAFSASASKICPELASIPTIFLKFVFNLNQTVCR